MRVALTFTPAVFAISHQYRYSLAGLGAWTSPATLVDNIVDGLEQATEYDFQVRGVNVTGFGEWSNIATATTTSGPAESIQAAAFDGTNDFMTLPGTFAGVTDGRLGTLAALVKFDGGDGVQQTIVSQDSARCLLRKLSSNLLFVTMLRSDTVIRFDFTGTTPFTAASGWLHILASWNTDFTAGNKIGRLWVNDVNQTPTFADAGAAFNIDYTPTVGWKVGATGAGNADKLNGQIAYVWMDLVNSIDFSVEANRRMFIDASGAPVYLGENGEIPLTTTPTLFLLGPAAGLPNNRGTGLETFTVTGALTDGETIPYGV